MEIYSLKKNNTRCSTKVLKTSVGDSSVQKCSKRKYVHDWNYLDPCKFDVEQ